MEQNVQKQTSGCDSYCVRSVLGGTGQDTCIICAGYKENPLDETSIGALLHLIKEQDAKLTVVYHIPQSLSHYGKVDSLVTAGAMSDFVDYVYGLEQEESLVFFQKLAHSLARTSADGVGHSEKPSDEKNMGDIAIIREPHEWKKLLQGIQERYAQVLIFSPK